MEDDLSMSVVSGCRDDKFSVHIVMDRVYCDSAVLSMPLVVFEIARRFLEQNVYWLITNTDLWNTPEGIFRVKALMHDHLGSWVMSDDMEKFAFAGYNDTPFDEAIYSKNHFLWAPGACKATSLEVGYLHPILGDGDVLMRREYEFRDRYEDMELWKKHLIQNHRESGYVHVISGLELTDAYPSKYNFFGSKRVYGDIV